MKKIVFLIFLALLLNLNAQQYIVVNDVVYIEIDGEYIVLESGNYDYSLVVDDDDDDELFPFL